MRLFTVFSLLLPLACSQGSPDDQPPLPPAQRTARAPRPRHVKVTPPVDLEARARTSAQAAATGHTADMVSHFTPALAKRMPVAKVSAQMRKITVLTGDYLSLGMVKRIRRGKMQVYVVKVIFERGIWDLVLTFDARGRIEDFFSRPTATSWRPPAYARPAPAQIIAVRLGKDPWALPGELTIPSGKGPFPSVILIHDRGAWDMDETIYSQKPFKDLALGLTARGVAVLRYEKRTRAHARRIGTVPGFSPLEETVLDAADAFSFLEKIPALDPHRIHLLGHGWGAYVLPLIAERTPTAGGYILWAPRGQHPAQARIRRLTYLAGLTAADTQQERMLKLERRRSVRAMDKDLPEVTPAHELPGGRFSGAYWRFLAGYDPMQSARALKSPTLLIHCDGDFEISPKEDLSPWKRALKGTTKFREKILRGCNHLGSAQSGTPSRDSYLLPGHVQEPFIKDLTAFLTR